MKYSFRVKIVAMLFAAILATIGLCFLFNSTLLVRYYEYQKIQNTKKESCSVSFVLDIALCSRCYRNHPGLYHSVGKILW